VIDAEGNCLPVDIFLLLPGADNVGQELLDGIVRDMPGINIVPWEYTAAHEVEPRGNLGALRRGDDEKTSASEVCKRLGIPSTPWERLAALASDTTSTKRLHAAGVSYVVDQVGRVRRAHLAKSGD
jgi:hypothetical protein